MAKSSRMPPSGGPFAPVVPPEKFKELVNAVLARHGITSEELFAGKNSRPFVRARGDLYVRLHKLGATPTEIARLTGFARTTVVYALEQAEVAS